MKKVDIKLLMRKKDELLRKRQALLDRAVEEERGYTDKERAEAEALQNQVDEYDNQIQEAQEIERRRAGIPANQPKPSMQYSDLVPGVMTRASEKNYRFFNMKTGSEVRSFLPSEDWCANREYHLPDGIRPDELSLARAVRGIMTGTWKGAEAEQRVMSEGTGFLGGWMVPSPLADKIIQEARKQLRVIQAGAVTLEMDQPEFGLAIVNKEPAAYWIAENQKAHFSDMNFKMAILHAKKLVAVTKLSEEIVMDAVNIGDILQDALAFAISKELDSKALIGSGTGEPLGLFNTDGIGSSDLSSASFTYDDFLSAIFSLVGHNVPIERISALFNAGVAGVLAKAKDENSQYLIPPEEFKKVKKYLTSQIDTADTLTTHAYLGDFSSLIIGLRSEISLNISRQASDADGNSAFERMQVWFRAHMRVDSMVVKPSSFHVLKDGGI